MSDRPIQPGDLVIQVRGHSCALEMYGGKPFQVQAILYSLHGFSCNKCRRTNVYPPADFVEPPQHGAIPLVWLKRIPPLGELEGRQDEHDIPVPKKKVDAKERNYIGKHDFIRDLRR